MRAKSFLPVLATILLVLPAIGVVNAQETAAPAITEQANQTIDITAVEQTATESQVSNDALEAINQAETLTNVCGECSTATFCRGAIRGTSCGFDKWCIPTNTLLCPGTSDWNCQCARNYN